MQRVCPDDMPTLSIHERHRHLGEFRQWAIKQGVLTASHVPKRCEDLAEECGAKFFFSQKTYTEYIDAVHRRDPTSTVIVYGVDKLKYDASSAQPPENAMKNVNFARAFIVAPEEIFHGPNGLLERFTQRKLNFLYHVIGVSAYTFQTHGLRTWAPTLPSEDPPGADYIQLAVPSFDLDAKSTELRPMTHTHESLYMEFETEVFQLIHEATGIQLTRDNMIVLYSSITIDPTGAVIQKVFHKVSIHVVIRHPQLYGNVLVINHLCRWIAHKLAHLYVDPSIYNRTVPHRLYRAAGQRKMAMIADEKALLRGCIDPNTPTLVIVQLPGQTRLPTFAESRPLMDRNTPRVDWPLAFVEWLREHPVEMPHDRFASRQAALTDLFRRERQLGAQSSAITEDTVRAILEISRGIIPENVVRETLRRIANCPHITPEIRGFHMQQETEYGHTLTLVLAPLLFCIERGGAHQTNRAWINLIKRQNGNWLPMVFCWNAECKENRRRFAQRANIPLTSMHPCLGWNAQIGMADYTTTREAAEIVPVVIPAATAPVNAEAHANNLRNMRMATERFAPQTTNKTFGGGSMAAALKKLKECKEDRMMTGMAKLIAPAAPARQTSSMQMFLTQRGNLQNGSPPRFTAPVPEVVKMEVVSVLKEASPVQSKVQVEIAQPEPTTATTEVSVEIKQECDLNETTPSPPRQRARKGRVRVVLDDDEVEEEAIDVPTTAEDLKTLRAQLQSAVIDSEETTDPTDAAMTLTADEEEEEASESEDDDNVEDMEVAADANSDSEHGDENDESDDSPPIESSSESSSDESEEEEEIDAETLQLLKVQRKEAKARMKAKQRRHKMNARFVEKGASQADEKEEELLKHELPTLITVGLISAVNPDQFAAAEQSEDKKLADGDDTHTGDENPTVAKDEKGSEEGDEDSEESESSDDEDDEEEEGTKEERRQIRRELLSDDLRKVGEKRQRVTDFKGFIHHPFAVNALTEEEFNVFVVVIACVYTDGVLTDFGRIPYESNPVDTYHAKMHCPDCRAATLPSDARLCSFCRCVVCNTAWSEHSKITESDPACRTANARQQRESADRVKQLTLWTDIFSCVNITDVGKCRPPPLVKSKHSPESLLRTLLNQVDTTIVQNFKDVILTQYICSSSETRLYENLKARHILRPESTAVMAMFTALARSKEGRQLYTMFWNDAESSVLLTYARHFLEGVDKVKGVKHIVLANKDKRTAMPIYSAMITWKDIAEAGCSIVPVLMHEIIPTIRFVEPERYKSMDSANKLFYPVKREVQGDLTVVKKQNAEKKDETTQAQQEEEAEKPAEVDKYADVFNG